MKKQHLIYAGAILTSLFALNNASAQACMKSSTFMELACIHDVKDDFWEARTICRNLEDTDDVKDCYDQAHEEQLEESAFCGEQKDARNELCELLGDDGPYAPDIDPANFLSPADTALNPNPFFPLVPGATRIYASEEEIVTVTVTEDTFEIAGVETIAVRDIVTDEEGELIEDTIDWYAQDTDGNVWYFGEIARDFEDGILVSIDGSFRAGIDGAKPGIIMLANPMIGDVYRQEMAWGEAEDAAEVLDLAGDDSVPAADCGGACLVTRDFSPMEPEANEHKYYAPGVGLVLEFHVEDGEADDRLELVEIIDP